MANHDSTTTANPQILDFQPVIESAISTLLHTPLGARHDLFQVLTTCERYSDALIENDNLAERMALCGRLLAGLEVLKVVLNQPLPEHLIECLTLEEGDEKGYCSPCTMDSESMRQYCSALTLVLLNQQESAEQQEKMIGVLFEMVHVLADDLKAPRFIRTPSGLMMIGGEAIPGIH